MRDRPEQQPPPVQRLRIRYAKRGRLRFASHRDFSRAFERALFRAGVPMAYSSGFNPHPRISYAGASPTGAASEAEYLEIGLAEELDPDVLHRELDASLPDGLDVLEVVVSMGGSLADRLDASLWDITVTGVDAEALRGAVEQLLATAEIPVERMTKKGLRVFDARSSVVSMDVMQPADGPTLRTVIRHGTPSVRPDDVLAALASVSGVGVRGVRSTRVSQGPLDPTSGTIGDPLAEDRNTGKARDGKGGLG